MSLRSLEHITTTALPDGVWFHRNSAGVLEYRPLAAAESDLRGLSVHSLRETLKRRSLPITLSSTCELREWIRTCLLRGAIAHRGTDIATHITGARLLRVLAETITGQRAAMPDNSRIADHSWPRRRSQLWMRCQRTVPLPTLPSELASIDELTIGCDIVWLAGKLLGIYSHSVVDMGPILGLRMSVGQEVRTLPGYEKLRQLLRQSPGRRYKSERVEQAADHHFIANIGSNREIRGTVSPYHPIRIRPDWRSESALVTVKIPAHIADTGQFGLYVRWPSAEIGSTINFGAGYPVDKLFAGASVDIDHPSGISPLLHHPLVNNENTVCVSDSAVLTGTQLTHQGADPGAIAAQTLLTIRDTVLYGYHAGFSTTVYNNYRDTVMGTLANRCMNHRDAHSRSRSERIEIIPWNR